MTMGLKANADGSGAIQVGGSDAITITSGLNTTFAGTASVATGALYPIVSGTAVASTSGTSIDFTSIPSWVKRITVMLSGFKISGSAVPIIQIGDSGGVENTGYLSTGSIVFAASACNAVAQTTGFGIGSGGASAIIYHGSIQISLLDATANTWCASGVLARSDIAAVINCGGAKSLSATLDRVRITTTGADTFTAGSINILYE